MSSATTYEATVLELTENLFLRDFADGESHAVSGGLLAPALADRQLPLVEVRAFLLKRAAVEDKDTIWRHLVERARAEGGSWTVAVIGMAAPMLKRTAVLAGRRFPAMRRDDMAGEVLTAFLEHMATMDLERPGICYRLRWATWRGVVKTVSRQAEVPVARIEPEVSLPAVLPASHPDVVLARAERVGVITSAEADLIGMTRLDEVTLAEAAQSLGITANAAKIRRQKAEARLVAFLTEAPIPARRDLKHARTRVQCAAAA